MIGTRVEIASRIAAALTSGLASGTSLHKRMGKINVSLRARLDGGVGYPALARSVEAPGKHWIRSGASFRVLRLKKSQDQITWLETWERIGWAARDRDITQCPAPL